MATIDPTPEKDAQTDEPAGFEFDTATDSHEVEAAYSWQYADRIYVTDDGEIVRSQDTDGYYGNDETFECSCGESFSCEADAKAHLRDKRVRGPPVPTVEQPGEMTWQEKSDTAFDGRVEYVPSTARGAGRIVDGADYLIATARSTYTPPANYGFEGWESLQSGQLSNHRNEPLFSARLLSRALATLSSGYQYTPERYTLYFRGHEPLYIEGPEDGIVIAERTPQM
ncbi:hypothetical protein [Haloarcula laminariae]|nr:hypothetical protein [Halomicroarcula sp. FL173]